MIFDIASDKDLDSIAKPAWPGSSLVFFNGSYHPLTNNCGLSTDATKFDGSLTKHDKNSGIFISFKGMSPPIGGYQDTEELLKNYSVIQHVDVIELGNYTLTITCLVSDKAI